MDKTETESRCPSKDVKYVCDIKSDEDESDDVENFNTSMRKVKNSKVKLSEIKKRWFIDEDNPHKIKWDTWVVIVLLFVAATLPFRIAFYDKDSKKWVVINGLIDLTFLIDMILTFFTTIPDEVNGG